MRTELDKIRRLSEVMLSPHFSLLELVRCREWDSYKLRQVDGLAVYPAHGPPAANVRDRLTTLCTKLLEPIRTDCVRRPMIINSGFRCYSLNASTKGSSAFSQHMYGEAADFRVPGYDDNDLFQVFRWIGWHSGLEFGQVIFEDRRPDDPTEGAWIHISLGEPYRPPERCGHRLTWTPKGYITHWTEPERA